MTLSICQNGYFYSHTFFESLFLNFESQLNFRFGFVSLLWPSGFRHCLAVQPDLGNQPCYEAPGDPWVEIVETQ